MTVSDRETVARLVGQAVKERWLVPFNGNPSFYMTTEDCSCVVYYDGDGYLDRYASVGGDMFDLFRCEGDDSLHELIDSVNALFGVASEEKGFDRVVRRIDYLAERCEAYAIDGEAA